MRPTPGKNSFKSNGATPEDLKKQFDFKPEFIIDKDVVKYINKIEESFNDKDSDTEDINLQLVGVEIEQEESGSLRD